MYAKRKNQPLNPSSRRRNHPPSRALLVFLAVCLVAIAASATLSPDTAARKMAPKGDLQSNAVADKTNGRDSALTAAADDADDSDLPPRFGGDIDKDNYL